MSQLQQVKSENFETEVLKSRKPVLVEFGAAWCQPCKILEPVLEELAKEWGETVKVAKLDVDEATQLTINYQVLSVPTTMLFKNILPSGTTSITRRKLASVGLSGMRSGVIVRTPPGALSAVESIHRNGRIIVNAPAISTA